MEYNNENNIDEQQIDYKKKYMDLEIYNEIIRNRIDDIDLSLGRLKYIEKRITKIDDMTRYVEANGESLKKIDVIEKQQSKIEELERKIEENGESLKRIDIIEKQQLRIEELERKIEENVESLKRVDIIEKQQLRIEELEKKIVANAESLKKLDFVEKYISKIDKMERDFVTKVDYLTKYYELEKRVKEYEKKLETQRANILEHIKGITSSIGIRLKELQIKSDDSIYDFNTLSENVEYFKRSLNERFNQLENKINSATNHNSVNNKEKMKIAQEYKKQTITEVKKTPLKIRLPFMEQYYKLPNNDFRARLNCVEVNLSNFSEIRRGDSSTPEFKCENGNFLMIEHNNTQYLLPNKSFIENPSAKTFIDQVFDISDNMRGVSLTADNVIKPAVIRKRDINTWICIEKGVIDN